MLQMHCCSSTDSSIIQMFIFTVIHKNNTKRDNNNMFDLSVLMVEILENDVQSLLCILSVLSVQFVLSIVSL